MALTNQSITSNAIVGQPLGILFGSRAARNEDGSLKLNANGFPTLDPQQGVIGNPNPDWRGGLGLRGYFKKLSFNILNQFTFLKLLIPKGREFIIKSSISVINY